MIAINHHNEAPSANFLATLQTELYPAVPVFDPTYPASEVSDLQFIRSSLDVQTQGLRRVFTTRQIEFAEDVTARRLQIAIADSVGLEGGGEEQLVSMLDVLIGARFAEQESAGVVQEMDITLTPDMAELVKPWDNRIRQVQELLTDRQITAQSRPHLSPYWLGPVRRAVLLQAKKSPDEVVRASARDLAERRLTLSSPRVARQARTARHAAFGLVIRAATAVAI